MDSNHLLLTGYRGCGKSVVGKILSELLCREFVDTDIAIEKNAGQTIADIFRDVGEEGFRDLESSQIASLRYLKSPAVISLGGGAVLRSENRQYIRELGTTVWLQATPEKLFERISNDVATQARRPKLSKLGDLEEIRSILAMRVAWYNEVADFAFSTDELSMEQVAKTIVHWFHSIV